MQTTIGQARIYHADNRDLLDELAGQYGAVLTDPPYGINIDRHKYLGNRNQQSKNQYSLKNWDSEAPDIGWIFALEIPAIVWGGNYFAPPRHRCGLVWNKNQPTDVAFADHEYAWTNLDRTACLLTLHSLTQARRDGGKAHQAQKPVELMKWCLSFLPRDVTIFDPFAGVGTTAVACEAMGIPSISIEREQDYFEEACRRIAAVPKDMFGLGA